MAIDAHPKPAVPTDPDGLFHRVCPLCQSPAIRRVHSKEVRGYTWWLAHCAACGLHFTDPRPSPQFLSAYYAGEYHAGLQVEGGTELAFGAKFRRYADWLGRFLPAGRVLDVGCSTGLLVKMLSDRGYQAEGIELNPGSAEWGRFHYGVTIHSGTLESCPIESGALDAVILTDVLEHTLNPLEFLRAVGERLAADGLVLVTFPDIQSLESRYLRSIARLLRRPWLWGNCHIPLHVWEFTPKTARACFHAAGFEVVDHRRSHLVDLEESSSLVRLIVLPTRVLGFSLAASRLGTQMEFLIRKVARPSTTGQGVE
jgi:2-polyprenyl-3-methyl-5-hydroxy-6-metoxy-1,4-benzoquinol methylase